MIYNRFGDPMTVPVRESLGFVVSRVVILALVALTAPAWLAWQWWHWRKQVNA